ncbi:tRNA pseudouridine(55) synthase TruB [Nitrosomonas sp. Nm166]|uniref:tRNA pseudouridine(55) synthase TruB n=1 Tax=Nitrosomonas sp. Nm166 TaxID=1881054 RepID=UPI0008F3922E|nr:tRNA pseudouridine(55) synthase TruB [Nitrosomonas sp. Nm166]SFE82130.1 tRNA pseudouridine55 synthase [Nitrosomonas sp. Nm166]
MLQAKIPPSKTIKSIKRNISGVLLLDKPYGISSNKAVQIAKRIFSAAKCGHTGTLDPMATGLLPLCFGEATKFSSVLLGANKTYEATLRLGFISTTGDAEGEISQFTANAGNPTPSQCEQVLKCFIGRIRQVPPMYSALKHQGKPLYVYARNNKVIERPAREVLIHDIQIKSLIDNELQLHIECGTGTYIRTLAEDIGRALGCGGAYLTQLRRTTIDSFDLFQAQALSTLEAMDTMDRDDCLLPVDCLLQEFPAVILNESAALHIRQGRIISNPPDVHSMPEGNIVRLYDHQQQFLGLGEITDKQKIAAKRLLVNP